MSDFQFTPDSWSAKADEDVTIALTNEGAVAHEWVILQSDVTIESEADLPDTEEELLADFVLTETEVPRASSGAQMCRHADRGCVASGLAGCGPDGPDVVDGQLVDVDNVVLGAGDSVRIVATEFEFSHMKSSRSPVSTPVTRQRRCRCAQPDIFRRLVLSGCSGRLGSRSTSSCPTTV